jgi:hypothetical protein
MSTHPTDHDDARPATLREACVEALWFLAIAALWAAMCLHPVGGAA